MFPSFLFSAIALTPFFLFLPKLKQKKLFVLIFEVAIAYNLLQTLTGDYPLAFSNCSTPVKVCNSINPKNAHSQFVSVICRKGKTVQKGVNHDRENRKEVQFS